MVIYASIKFSVMWERHNPNISTTEEFSALKDTEKVNLSSEGLKIAWHAENFDREVLHDPRFVKFVIMLYGLKDGEEYGVPVQYHECTEAELRQFATPSKDSVDQLEDMIASESRKLFCLDWEEDGDELSLYGTWAASQYRYISIALTPCNYIPEGFENLYPISDECVRNETAQREYLSNFFMRIYAEDQVFKQDQYDE